jgi:hypothetical protein
VGNLRLAKYCEGPGFLVDARGFRAKVGLMKKLFSFASLTLGLTQFGLAPALFAQAPPATPAGAPRIQFAATSFDFGKVLPTDKPMHEFVFTNVGTALLEITDVHPGCGCTTAGTWDRQVEPGKTGKIPLSFNPANFNGTVSKGATVTCNDPAQATHYLSFQATIFRPIDMQPQYAYFLPVEGEATNETKLIHIVNNQDAALTLDPPEVKNASFKTEIKTVRAGKEFELLVTYLGSTTNGVIHDTVVVKTSSTNAPTLNLTAMVMPQPAVIAVPQPIQIPAAPLAPNYSYPVTVRNNSHTLIKLSEPTVNAPGVLVQINEVEPGKNFTLNIGFPSDFRVPPGNSLELAVKTTHPKYPVLRLPITQLPATTPVAVPQPVATGAK